MTLTWTNTRADVFTALLLSDIPTSVNTIYQETKGLDHLSDKDKKRSTRRNLEDLRENYFVDRTRVDGVYHYYPTKLGAINFKVNVINRLEAHLNG